MMNVPRLGSQFKVRDYFLTGISLLESLVLKSFFALRMDSFLFVCLFKSFYNKERNNVSSLQNMFPDTKQLMNKIFFISLAFSEFTDW